MRFMVPIQNMPGRLPKRRTAARALMILWASFWILLGAGFGLADRSSLAEILYRAAVPGLVFVTLAALAWRSEGTGGAILLGIGIAIGAAYPLTMGDRFPLSAILFIETSMAILPLTAGGLLLAAQHNRQTASNDRSG